VIFGVQNPGNDQAEQQFMKIGQAYEQLTSAQYKQSNFYGHGQRRQQNSYQSRQQVSRCDTIIY
jgi:DnaJ-class molecular chaperone